MHNSTSSSSSSSYKNILSHEGYKQLKFIKYYSNSNSNFNSNFNYNICPIIGAIFKENDDIIQLPCSHYFEPESILKWVKEKNAECPICRFKLNSIEVNDDVKDVNNDYPDYAEHPDQNNTIRNFLLNLYKRNALLNIINNVLTNDNDILTTTNMEYETNPADAADADDADADDADDTDADADDAEHADDAADADKIKAYTFMEQHKMY